MDFILGFYHSKGTFKAENGKEINYDNVCFVVGKKVSQNDAWGFVAAKEPLRVPFAKFEQFCGVTYADFLEHYGSRSTPIPYRASFIYNEYQKLVLSDLEFYE